MMKYLQVLLTALAVIFCSNFTAIAGSISSDSRPISPFILEPGTYTMGARLLFDYKPDCKSDWIRDIDVVNVWEMVVSENPNGRSHVAFNSMPSYGLLPMQDGPFAGYRVSLDFSLDQLGNGKFKGTGGVLSFYSPDGEQWDPDGNAKNGTGEKFRTKWNGQFGADGEYAMKKSGAGNFYRWMAHDIVTFVEPGAYSVETGLFWNEQNAMLDDGNPNNNISFVIPSAAATVPEPASMALIGSSLVVLAGFGRKIKRS